MPIVVTEKYGRRLSGDRAELTYTILGTTSDADARAALLVEAPTSHGGLPRDTNAVEVDEIKGVVGGGWIGTVLYQTGGGSTQQEGESTFQFETSGSTQHVTQAVGGQAAYDSSGAITDPFGRAIGVTDNGVDGVDITTPIYTFSETHWIADADVDASYKGTLFDLTGRMNDALYKGLAAGEALFLGAAGTRRGDNPWEITFAFAGSKNESNLSVGDITVATKLGWDYLWVKYQTQEDATNKLLVRKPLIAVVSPVYKFGDFSGLGIGT